MAFRKEKAPHQHWLSQKVLNDPGASHASSPRPGGRALGLAETVLWVPWGVGCPCLKRGPWNLAPAGNLNLLDESQCVLSDVDQAPQSLHWFLGRRGCIRKLCQRQREKTVCLDRPITIVSEPAQGHSCWEGRVGAFWRPECYIYLPFPLDEAYVSQHSKRGQLIKAPGAAPNTMRHTVAELITKGFSAWPYTMRSRTCKVLRRSRMVSEEFRNCKHKRTPTCVHWRPANSEKQISSTADHIKQRVFRKQTNKQKKPWAKSSSRVIKGFQLSIVYLTLSLSPPV